MQTFLDSQIKAIDKLNAVKCGALFMEAGTGKTRSALELSNRFRGELFMEITGLKGQDLGAFISYYKNIYSGFTDLKTDSWEFTASQDEIRYDIEQKYAEYKKNILHGDIA